MEKNTVLRRWTGIRRLSGCSGIGLKPYQEAISQRAEQKLLSFTAQLNLGAATPRPDSVHFWVTGWQRPVKSVVFGGYCQQVRQLGKTTASLYDWQFAGEYAKRHQARGRK